MEQAHADWNVFDGVLRRWDALMETYDDAVLAEWPLDWYVGQVFGGWKVKVALRSENMLALVMSRKGLLATLLVGWVEDEDEHFPGAASVVRVPLGPDVRLSMGQFDEALGAGLTGRDPMALIDGLLTMPPSPGGPLYAPMRLTIEALVLSLPVEEQAGARMLLGLRGIGPVVEYELVREGVGAPH